MKCTLCPRGCGVDREATLGACSVPSEIRIAKSMLHMWEEPPISGENGSGAIFFSGCPLKCVFCQNKEISHTGKGKTISVNDLAKLFLDLQKRGAHNINLVSPTQYSDKIRDALDLVKGEIKIPIVYNTSGYELDTELEKMRSYVDIFLTDIKYFSSELSSEYSRASDYFEVAKKALLKMLDIVPKCVFDENGIMKNGVILRHLVMPSHRADSIKILDEIASVIDIKSIKLSLMSQYTPDFCDEKYKKINRRVTSFEYDSVVEHALALGYDGYIQERASANKIYTPEWEI